jgi:hypothetical protein
MNICCFGGEESVVGNARSSRLVAEKKQNLKHLEETVLPFTILESLLLCYQSQGVYLASHMSCSNECNLNNYQFFIYGKHP